MLLILFDSIYLINLWLKFMTYIFIYFFSGAYLELTTCTIHLHGQRCSTETYQIGMSPMSKEQNLMAHFVRQNLSDTNQNLTSLGHC